jgi:hypothetical protein
MVPNVFAAAFVTLVVWLRYRAYANGDDIVPCVDFHGRKTWPVFPRGDAAAPLKLRREERAAISGFIPLRTRLYMRFI